LIISVTDMKPNDRGIVVQIGGGHGLARRLQIMGIRVGAMITKRSAQLFRGPVTIRVGGTDLALGFGLARRIMVEVKR